MILLEIIAFVAIVWGLAFFNMPAKIWTPAVGLSLIILSILPGMPWLFLTVCWLLFIVAGLIFNISSLRQKFLTSKVLRYFQKVLPPISTTERDAIEAGDVWWEGDLFRGHPDWKKFLDMQIPTLKEEEQAFLDNQVETLCAMLDDWDMVHNLHDMSPAVWEYLKKEKFLGLAIPKEYGGHGFSTLAHSNIVTKIASRSASAAISVMVPNALGPGEFLRHFGTTAQKQYYLPRLANGEEIPAFALTSPEAGSDAGSIPDTGVVCKGMYENKEVIGIKLNWDKRYITLAPIATLMGLAIKLHDPQHLLGDIEDIGITLCLVPTNLPGVEVGSRHFPVGLAFLNGPTRGKDVFIPIDFIIGGVENRGKGWSMMMEGLAVGRGISLPALGTACAQLCYRMTGAYANLREQFNQPIGRFEGVEEALARIGGLTYIIEATRRFTLSAIDQEIKPALAAAITKYHLAELARTIANDAMDVHAGRGIQLGPRNYLGLLHQSLPISITVEGANILTRNLIIFGQGAIRCHPYIRAELAAVEEADPVQRLKLFDGLLYSHIGYAVNNFARVLLYGLTGGFFINTPIFGELGHYYRQLTRMSAALALCSDVILAILGGQLKRKERISARLGDVLSQLYLGSAVLKYYQNQEQPAEDLPLVHWSLQNCLYQTQCAFSDVLDNVKPRWLARILYWVIFPWGRAYRPPQDSLGHQIAAGMMKSSVQRDRLTEFCYLGKDNQDSVGRMEHALKALENSADARAKLRAAIANNQIAKNSTLYQQIDEAEQKGILMADEIKLLHDFAALRWDAIQVDEFTPQDFGSKSQVS